MPKDNRSANNAFLNDVVSAIPGFPSDFCFTCLMDLLDMQHEQRWKGSLLEIGVYAGRFAAVLAREAARRSSHLVGLDPFMKFSESEVRERLEAAAEFESAKGAKQSAKITLIKDLSGNWTPDRLLGMLGERCRFVHIDGSHLRADVLWDLTIADSIISPYGVIALDDYHNPQCLGVAEATFQFLSSQSRLSVPFAFVAGKLLLSGRLHAAKYKSRLEAYVSSDTVWGISRLYQRRMKNGATWLNQMLMGSEIAVIAGEGSANSRRLS